ncbi:DUF1716-domain-containing protein [Zopfochytrium polystomum]|nr:DUF1716-domain-containing protein [Zopfochytrium polystomum]
MNIDTLFKMPALPAGKLTAAKRRMPEQPPDGGVKRLKANSGGTPSSVEMEDDSEAPDPSQLHWGVGTADSGASARLPGSSDPEEDRFYGDGLSDRQREIYDIVDSAEDNGPAMIDVPALKKMIARLEKAAAKNEEMRVRFPDEPLKFIESEADLDEELNNLMAASAAPELYPQLISLGTVNTILELLGHENTDVAIASVKLLCELTDDDTVAEAEEAGEAGAKALAANLIENQVLELVVNLIMKLNEDLSDTEDRQGVYSSLNLIENLVTLSPPTAELVVSKTALPSFLLKRIQRKPFDSNKQYASELLAILLQDSKPNRLNIIASPQHGVGVLLKVLSAYRKKDPVDADEVELMENCFDALCSCLLEREGKLSFLEDEGVELMIIMLRERKMSRMRALKVLSHALLGDDGADCCETFVQKMGLKAFFPIFMRKGLRSYRKEYKTHSEHEEDEHVASILVSLQRNLQGDSRLRLNSKFSENGCEKLDRLLELHDQYTSRVSSFDKANPQGPRDIERDDDEGDDALDTEEERYLKRLENGLFTLQLVDLAMGYACAEDGEDEVRNHLKKLLSRRGESFRTLVAVLAEYAANIGDPNAPPNDEKVRVLEVAKKLLTML